MVGKNSAEPGLGFFSATVSGETGRAGGRLKMPKELTHYLDGFESKIKTWWTTDFSLVVVLAIQSLGYPI